MTAWLPVVVIFTYLAAVLYIGIFAFRRGKETGEDFFLASRSIGSIVFFLSLFATNMTAFAIIGSSGASYRQGIGIFGMMATSSCLVIPLTLFLIGTRLWAVGKRFGHMTQVAFFRDRWECSSTGTVIFLVTAAMLLPYLIISIVGGGIILESLTNAKISYPVGGAIVALVVMGNVFFGGMRGAVWVNVLQTTLFLCFGVVAFAIIGHKLPNGFQGTVTDLMSAAKNKPGASPFARPETLLTRERIPWQVFLSFMLIPLSSIMFPHMSIMCFTARKVTAFRKTVVFYPICIMLIWLPCVFLGALAFNQVTVTNSMAGKSEDLKEYLEHHGEVAPGAFVMGDINTALRKSKDPAAISLMKDVTNPAQTISPEHFIERLVDVSKKSADPSLKPLVYKIAGTNDSSVLLELLKANLGPILAGILAAGIISAVMGSDCHQILALSTMFTKDIFGYYGGKRVSEHSTVMAGRAFIIILNVLAYIVALGKPQIFELATTYAFAGFAAMSPVMIGALFWKRSTKLGALSATFWVAALVLWQVYLGWQHATPGTVIWQVGKLTIFAIAPNGALSCLKFTMVVPMVLGSATLMYIVSLITPAPSQPTINKYFPGEAGIAR